MGTTIPDGVDAARVRKARRDSARRLSLTGDEARYVVAYMRWRVGKRATPPDAGHYLGRDVVRYRVEVLKREAAAYLILACAGQDEEADA